MTVSDRIVATIRTFVPALWGVAITWLVGRFPVVQDVLDWLTETLDEDVTAAIGFVLTAAVIAAFYWAARALSARFPWLEKWLVGSSLTPIYESPSIARR